MNILVITVAGASRRFGRSIGKDVLKCLFYRDQVQEALLYRLVKQPPEFDHYIIVGGYMYEELGRFVRENFHDMLDRITLVENQHYDDYGSCLSLYLGLEKADEFPYRQLVFAEGDLLVDRAGFQRLCTTGMDAVTSNREDIRSDTAVVFYYDSEGRIHYLYDTEHHLLRIPEPFTAIFNSGQIWKFMKKERVKDILDSLTDEDLKGTNLVIIQRYFGELAWDQYEHVKFERWVNCNTISDFERALDLED